MSGSVENDLNKIDADLYNNLIEDRMIIGFSFDELIQLRARMDEYGIKSILADPKNETSVFTLFNFADGEGII